MVARLVTTREKLVTSGPNPVTLVSHKSQRQALQCEVYERNLCATVAHLHAFNVFISVSLLIIAIGTQKS